MRITHSMIARNLLHGINQNRQRMNDLQQDIASGKDLHKSSDDPVRFSRAARFRKTISNNEQYLNNISKATGWITNTVSLLESIYDRVLDAKNFATQGANDTNDSSNRSALGDQIETIIKEIVSLANSKYLGKNVFAGTKTLEDQPFVYDGAAVTYSGNEGQMTRRISANFNVAINVNGKQIVDTNVFSALVTLKDALNSNDQAGIQASIDTIQSVADSFLSLSSAMGSIQKQLQLTQVRLETTNTNLAAYLSETENVDLAEAITQYNSEEMAYRAALQVTSDVVQLNLLDFLG